MGRLVAWLVAAGAALVAASDCPIYSCDDTITKCLHYSEDKSKDTTTISLNSKACPAGQECFITEDYHSDCLPEITRTQTEMLYPGYSCGKDVYGNDQGTCTFGSKYCTADKKCAGVPLYGACRRSSDCYFGSFCNFGYCVPLLADGEPCNSHEACSRKSLCLFIDISKSYGICTQISSINDKETNSAQILAEIPGENRFAYQEGIEKLCRTGWVNRADGQCQKLVSSANKGKPCLSDQDCPTDDTGIYATCRCGFGTKGLKYCDIQGNDDEWVAAANAFKLYHEHSYNCHTAENFGPCHEETLFKDWKCKELKAKLYVDLVDIPECLTDMFIQHPYFSEYAAYCLASSLQAAAALFTLLLIS